MKHVKSQAEKPNCKKENLVSERAVAPSSNAPDLASLLRAYLHKPDAPVPPPDFRADTMNTELRLRVWPYDLIQQKPRMLSKLDKLASKGASLYQMYDALAVDPQALRELRLDYEWFDQMFNGLEDRAAYERSLMSSD